MRVRASAVLTLVATFCVADGIVLPATRGSHQQRPSFQSSVVLVPVDVRVLDRKTGKGVTDLERDDFTIAEDGVPQPIRHFEVHAFKADPGAASKSALTVRDAAFGTTPQEQRVFLIVLGRGRLQEPSRALDALERFVRERLLPQDLVAVFAYNRATEFSTDHAAVAAVIARFRRAHEQIDSDVQMAINNSMAAIYGSRALPKAVQAKIDAVFRSVDGVASAEIGKGETTATKRAEADGREQAGRLQEKSVQHASQQMYEEARKNLGAGIEAPPITWTSLDEVASRQFSTLGLDEFMANTAQSLEDLGNCYAGIEYLRHFEGEKHLIFVTERGVNLPRVDDDMALTRAANDARVAIDTLQTGGVEGQPGGTWTDQSTQTFAFQALRVIAEQTGGVSSVGERATAAVDRIDEASRTDYLLGYYPPTSGMNGAYRKIEVKVNRPDVIVVYRRGYYARAEVPSFNRRAFITKDRIQAAAKSRREVDDIKVKMDVQLREITGVPHLDVSATIDPSRLALTLENGNHVGALDIMIVCFDDRLTMIGQLHQPARIRLSEEMFQKALKSGIPYAIRLSVNPAVRRVRLIVYDYKADLVGTVDGRVF